MAMHTCKARAADMQHVHMKGTRTVEEAVRLVAKRVSAAPPGEWIQGAGWDQNIWPERAFPNKGMLDAVATDNPVLLSHTSGHCTWVNSAALEAAGITANTGAPIGGAIDRDGDGDPTGILRDHASNLAYVAMPSPTAAAREANLLAAQRHAHSLGLTGVHAMDVQTSELESLEKLHGEGRLSLRVRAYFAAPQLERFEGRRSWDGDDVLRVGGTKFFSDGALGSLTAWTHEPFEGTDDRGLPLQPIKELEERVRLAPAIHAIGDRANSEVLTLLDRVRNIRPKLPRRIEHAQLLGEGDLERFVDLDVSASVQPIHLTQDYEKVDRSWGDRGRLAYMFQSFLRSNMNLAFGSDTPVETMNPLVGIHAAVTRQQANSAPEGGWYPEERVSLEDATRAYSTDCAAAAGESHRFGRIAKGYAADFVMLDRDIFSLKDHHEILAAKVDVTIAGGNIVYERGG